MPGTWRNKSDLRLHPGRSGTVTRPYGDDHSGFTLIELVVVIVIVGILSALGGQFIVAPITGYVDLSRRARLVDQAEMAMRRMQRDIRAALPNSIRIDPSGKYLELLNTVSGGRYRRYPDPDSAIGNDILNFDADDNSFDVLGDLSRVPQAGEYLVIYNVSATGNSGNAYSQDSENIASVTSGATDSINFTDYTFATPSPYQRFFVVDGPVTYVCESGVLNRYDGYALSATQPVPPTSVTEALVTRNVSDCEFTYDPGATQRAGLVTLEISLTEAEETINLIHQVHVVNAP